MTDKSKEITSLPTDDQIFRYLIEPNSLYSEHIKSGLIRGAKWMRDKFAVPLLEDVKCLTSDLNEACKANAEYVKENKTISHNLQWLNNEYKDLEKQNERLKEKIADLEAELNAWEHGL